MTGYPEFFLEIGADIGDGLDKYFLLHVKTIINLSRGFVKRAKMFALSKRKAASNRAINRARQEENRENSVTAEEKTAREREMD